MTTNTHLLISKFIRTSALRRIAECFATILGLLICSLLSAKPVWAHGFALRYDLPLPLDFYLIASAAVVLLSFGIMARARETRSPLNSYRIPLAQFIPNKKFLHVVRILVRCASVILFFIVIFSGLFGNQNPLKNIAPVTVWVIWWVGFVYLTALIGNTWSIVNPWSSIYQSAEKVFGIQERKPNTPEQLGVWPAVILFFVFAWIELVWPGSEEPRLLATMVLAYSGLCWLGMSVYGRRTWLRKGEVFSIIFAVFGRFF